MTDVSVTLRPPCWCPSAWAPTWRLHAKLYKFGWNTFPNNTRMNHRTDLNLGEVVYISIIFHIPVSFQTKENSRKKKNNSRKSYCDRCRTALRTNPDTPRCLRLRRSQGALRCQDKFHVRCFHTHVRYLTKLLKTLPP